MGGGYGGNRLPTSESDNGSRADSGPFRANAYVGLPRVNPGPGVWTFGEGHVGEFPPRRSYGQSAHPRSGLKSVAQGLPWVALPTRIALKGATIYGDNRLGAFEPVRVRVSGPFRAKRHFRLTQGKPWAKLFWPLRATGLEASKLQTPG
jgi:hypothetical protein